MKTWIVTSFPRIIKQSFILASLLISAGNLHGQNIFCICTGDTVVLNASSTALSYLWNTGDTTNSIKVGAAGTYTCARNVGSAILIDSFEVNDCSSFGAFLIDYDSSIIDTVQFFNTSANGISYLWQFGDGDTSTLVDPKHKYQGKGPFKVCLIVYATCDTDTVCQYISWVGIKRDSGPLEMLIYPNPVSEILNISFRQTGLRSIEVNLMDVSGRRVLNGAFNALEIKNDIEIDVSSQEEGLYLLRLSDGINTYTRRVLIRR